MKSLDNGTFEHIVLRVLEECNRRGVSGVFAMVDLSSLSTSTTIRWESCLRQSLLRIDVPDKNDANFLAVALSKLSMVIAHRKHTGYETQVIGEVPFMGGRLSADGSHAYAFSGASQEEDDQIVQVAEAFHATLP